MNSIWNRAYWWLKIKIPMSPTTGFPGGTSGKEPTCTLVQKTREMQIRSLGQEDPWRRVWWPIHHSCLENPIDRGAWRATVHGVMKSQTQLKWLSTHVGTWDYYFQQVIVSRMLTRMPGVGWQPGDITVVQRWCLHWINLLVDTHVVTATRRCIFVSIILLFRAYEGKTQGWLLSTDIPIKHDFS